MLPVLCNICKRKLHLCQVSGLAVICTRWPIECTFSKELYNLLNKIEMGKVGNTDFVESMILTKNMSM